MSKKARRRPKWKKPTRHHSRKRFMLSVVQAYKRWLARGVASKRTFLVSPWKVTEIG